MYEFKKSVSKSNIILGYEKITVDRYTPQLMFNSRCGQNKLPGFYMVTLTLQSDGKPVSGIPTGFTGGYLSVFIAHDFNCEFHISNTNYGTMLIAN